MLELLKFKQMRSGAYHVAGCKNTIPAPGHGLGVGLVAYLGVVSGHSAVATKEL